MRLRLSAFLLACLALVSSAQGGTTKLQRATKSPPRAGLVVPGASLGGLRLGMTKAQVLATWGRDHGVCRDCPAPTWYYTYRPFTQPGAAVEFTRGRVSGLWTIWSPPGWHTPLGLRIGDVDARITELYGTLTPSLCTGYSALMLPRGRVVTSFYVVDGKVWGFGLSRLGARVCR
jgi:hypothetical protein